MAIGIRSLSRPGVLGRAASLGPIATAALVGVASALAGSVAGATWRQVSAERGWTWQAALAEDGVAIALAVVACRPTPAH